MSKKKIAVVLSGCGVYDGAEIHEATLSLLAIARAGATYQCFAPDVEQAHVINHLSGEEMAEKRNVLVESARIARGAISPLNQFNADDYDGILFPGGFGAAKNLCTFAFDGVECSVNPDVETVVKEVAQKGKPIGALCISPVLITKILGNVEVTIGQDQGTIAAVESLGGSHRVTDHGEIVIDKANKIVTTPCYMLDASIDQIADGADRIVNALLDLMK